METRGRPIVPDSIRHTEDGTRLIRIGNHTYDRIQQLSQRNESMAATISRIVKSQLPDNTQGKMIDTADPATKKEVFEVKGAVESMAALLCLSLGYMVDPKAWLNTEFEAELKSRIAASKDELLQSVYKKWISIKELNAEQGRLIDAV